MESGQKKASATLSPRGLIQWEAEWENSKRERHGKKVIIIASHHMINSQVTITVFGYQRKMEFQRGES